MMQISKYIPLIILLVVSLFMACEKEYVAPANTEFQDVVVVQSGIQTIQRGDFTSFADLSKGFTSRNWIIPQSAQFLNTEGKDPNELNTIVVQFDEPGMQEVGLQLEFPDATLNLDTSFTVEVLDFISAEIDVVNINSGFIDEQPNQITMYEGGIITFADSTRGKPNRRIWQFEGGSPRRVGGLSVDEDKEVQSIDVSYADIGVYDVTLISWRQFPDGTPDTITLVDYVNVIKNEEPPSLINVTENAAGIIQLLFDLPMKIDGDPSASLTLTVADTTMAITNIAINAENGNIIDITPAVDIDHITSSVRISYDGNGGLARLNGVLAPGFDDQEVALYVPPNALAMAGFDPSFSDCALTGWNVNVEPSNANPITVNTGVAVEMANIGFDDDCSMVIRLNPDANLAEGEKNNFRLSTDFAVTPITFEEGKTYRAEFWYRVEGGNGVGEFTWRYHNGGEWAPALGGGWTGGNLVQPDGQWKFRRITWKAPTPTAISDGRISIQFISKNNVATDVYLDNLSVYALD